MKKITFTLVLAFCISTMLHAQNKPAGTPISGVVVDGGDNEPLIGATIRVAGKNTGALTDLDGRFTVIAEPHDLIQVNYVGYEPLELMPDEITQNLKNMVHMHAGTMLQEVVITAERTKLISISTSRSCYGDNRLFNNTEIPTIDQDAPALMEGDLTFSYFPNPTVEGVTVTSSLIAGEIEVVSPNGALVKTQRITDTYTRITMTDLPSGMYFLHYRYKVITALIGQVVLARD